MGVNIGTGGRAAMGVHPRLVGTPAPEDGRDYFLQQAMLDATPDCIKIISPEGRVLTMNRAGCLALNVPLDSKFGMPWIPLLPESVHELGFQALRAAAAGETARFPGQSESPGGTMYWDNLLNPIVDASGQVRNILVISRDVTAQRRLEQELAEAAKREKLLAREMQHRIKNLFSVVSGLIYLSETEAGEEGGRGAGATEILQRKIDALARASDAALPAGEADAALPDEVELGCLAGSVLAPYGARCRAGGGPVRLRRDEMTTVALLLHELATNSVKYGALGSRNGRVAVAWEAEGGELRLSWTEEGGPSIEASPQRQGFGSEMVDRLVESVGGRISKTWRRDGLVAELALPSLVVGGG